MGMPALAVIVPSAPSLARPQWTALRFPSDPRSRLSLRTVTLWVSLPRAGVQNADYCTSGTESHVFFSCLSSPANSTGGWRRPKAPSDSSRLSAESV